MFNNTAYHPRTNFETERLNTTIATRVLHYGAEHYPDRDSLVERLIYSSKNQFHRSTQVTPFGLTLTRPPPGPALGSIPTARPSDRITDLPKLHLRVLHRLPYMTGKTGRDLSKAQQRYRHCSYRKYGSPLILFRIISFLCTSHRLLQRRRTNYFRIFRGQT